MAAYYTFEDYSGTSTPNKSDNPYDGLIQNCNDDPVRYRLQKLHLLITHAQPATNPSHLPEPQNKPQHPAKVETPVSRIFRRDDR